MPTAGIVAQPAPRCGVAHHDALRSNATKSVAFDQAWRGSALSLRPDAPEGGSAAMTDHAAAKKLTWETAIRPSATPCPRATSTTPRSLRRERDADLLQGLACGRPCERACQEPGDFLTQDIFDQSVILVCGRDGAGARLSQCLPASRQSPAAWSAAASCGSRLRCGYHSWCYDLDGELRNAPRSERLDGFRQDAIRPEAGPPGKLRRLLFRQSRSRGRALWRS